MLQFTSQTNTLNKQQLSKGHWLWLIYHHSKCLRCTSTRVLRCLVTDQCLLSLWHYQQWLRSNPEPLQQKTFMLMTGPSVCIKRYFNKICWPHTNISDITRLNIDCTILTYCTKLYQSQHQEKDVFSTKIKHVMVFCLSVSIKLPHLWE